MQNYVHVCPIFPAFWPYILKVWIFFENKGTKLTPKRSDRRFLVKFSKVQQLSYDFSKKSSYIE